MTITVNQTDEVRTLLALVSATNSAWFAFNENPANLIPEGTDMPEGAEYQAYLTYERLHNLAREQAKRTGYVVYSVQTAGLNRRFDVAPIKDWHRNT